MNYCQNKLQHLLHFFLFLTIKNNNIKNLPIFFYLEKGIPLASPPLCNETKWATCAQRKVTARNSKFLNHLQTVIPFIETQLKYKTKLVVPKTMEHQTFSENDLFCSCTPEKHSLQYLRCNRHISCALLLLLSPTPHHPIA